MKTFFISLVCLCFSSFASASVIGFADIVLDFQDNGENVKGELGSGVFRDLGFTRALDGSITGEVADAVLGDDDTSYLSLLTGQSITLGFLDENIIDAAGADIFISELGSASESADIFASSDGVDFTFLGTANNAGGISTFDISTFDFLDPITAIRITSLNSFGGSPGFDLEFVEALNSVEVTPTVNDVNAPTTVFMFMIAIFAMLARRQNRKV